MLATNMNDIEIWNDLERDAKLVEEITAKEAYDIMELLQESIGLLANAFEISKCPDNSDATLARMGLLGHNFNTLNCSTNLAFRGYYLQSLNILRVVYENWVAYHYLSKHPEKAILWLNHHPQKQPPSHAKMLAKLGPDFLPVKGKMKEWYGTLCSFAHTDPLNLLTQLSNDFDPNETSVHFGTTFNLSLFKTTAYTLSLWIGIMLSTAKKLVPDNLNWHVQEENVNKKLIQYIENENAEYKKREN